MHIQPSDFDNVLEMFPLRVRAAFQLLVGALQLEIFLQNKRSKGVAK